MIRPYPRRVAGVPRAFGYDPDSRVFELAFDPSPSATLPTEVYVPAARHYPSGWTLEGCEESEGCAFTWNAEANVLEISTTDRSERVVLRLLPNP